MVSTHSKRRGKEGASEGASLKQVSLRSTRIDGFIIAFTKIFAVSPNKNSTLVKSEEHAGMHPKHHLPLQVCILAARWCQQLHPTHLTPTGGSQEARGTSSTAGEFHRGRQEAAAACRASHREPAVRFCLSEHQSHKIKRGVK